MPSLLRALSLQAECIDVSYHLLGIVVLVVEPWRAHGRQEGGCLSVLLLLHKLLLHLGIVNVLIPILLLSLRFLFS
jgi:hypothetical protein